MIERGIKINKRLVYGISRCNRSVSSIVKGNFYGQNQSEKNATNQKGKFNVCFVNLPLLVRETVSLQTNDSIYGVRPRAALEIRSRIYLCY